MHSMIDRFSGWLPVMLLAVLAALTFWLDHIVQPTAGTQAGSVRHDPDYIVDGLSAVRLDAQGRVKHTLLAQKMTHYPDDDVTELVDPQFVTYTDERAPITITAEHARVSSDGEDVYFKDQVRVVRSPHASESALVLETNYLHVIPEAHVAKTDQPVVVHNAAAVVNASGLELNSETRVLKLQGRVKTVFERTAPPPRNVR